MAASLLGLSLMEQSKFAEAEPLLVAGYKGLVERSSVLPKAVSLREAGESIVRLYTAWGKPDQEAAWRKELEAGKPASANCCRSSENVVFCIFGRRRAERPEIPLDTAACPHPTGPDAESLPQSRVS